MSALAVAGVMVCGSQARAALPFYAGPGDPNITTAHYTNVLVGGGVSNAGLSIGTADIVSTPSGVSPTKSDSVVLKWGPGLNGPTLLTRAAPASINNNSFASIGANGTIAVSVDGPNLPREYAYRYENGATVGTELDDIPNQTPPDEHSRGSNRVTDDGVVLGYSAFYFGSFYDGTRAVYWNPGSTTPAAQLAQFSSANAFAANRVNDRNNSGTYVGSGTRFYQATFGSTPIDRGDRAIRWDSATAQATELALPSMRAADGNPVPYGNARALSITNDGTVLGSYSDYNGGSTALVGSRPARWNAGGTAATALQVLGNNPASNGLTIDFATDINNSDVAVGSLQDFVTSSAGVNAAVKWNKGTSQLTRLSPVGVSSGASAINDRGTIVGGSTFNGAFHAAAWFNGSTTATDLNTLVAPPAGWVLGGASALSETGFISGYAIYTPTTGSSYTRLYTVLVPQAGTYGQGDGNFDTKVNFDDLIILAQHYNQSNTAKAINVGDFNLDGSVNFDDLILLAQNYNKTGAGAIVAFGASFAADWALAQSLVPEPTTLGVAACVFAACGTRLRRQDNVGF